MALEAQLIEQQQAARPDKIRFQNECLFDMLRKRIRASGHEFNDTLYKCYEVVVASDVLGGAAAAEARRLYREEISALEKVEKAKWPGSRDATALIRMFCSWFEAGRSLDAWLSYNYNRSLWKPGSDDERWQASQAEALAELPRRLIECERAGRTIRGAKLWEGHGVGADRNGQPWKPRQWGNILKRAASLAEKDPNKCTALEQWLWWSFPVFHRYKWNARQVIEAACKRELNEPLLDKSPTGFTKYWINRGLRFEGGKQAKSPKLEGFVVHLVVPDVESTRGIPIWKS